MEKYIIDILLITVVVISALVAARKGFFLTLMSIFSAVGALIGAKILADPVALFVYNSVIRNPVLAKVQSMLPATLTENDPQTVLNGILEQLPDGVAAMVENYGILDSAVAAAGDATAFFSMDNLEANYIKPFCLSVLALLATIIVFYILFVVLRMFSGMLNRLIYKNKKQPVNRFLGAVLGIVRAAIPLAVVVLLLNFAADCNINDSLTAAVENSKICAWVETVSPELFAGMTNGDDTQLQNA
ncbi:MAG: CvpA family protein [Ruminococcaceae bacterium]|nr:CvpA family protein [Oscillospiraceae bacterium]